MKVLLWVLTITPVLFHIWYWAVDVDVNLAPKIALQKKNLVCVYMNRHQLGANPYITT